MAEWEASIVPVFTTTLARRHLVVVHHQVCRYVFHEARSPFFERNNAQLRAHEASNASRSERSQEVVSLEPRWA